MTDRESETITNYITQQIRERLTSYRHNLRILAGDTYILIDPNRHTCPVAAVVLKPSKMTAETNLIQRVGGYFTADHRCQRSHTEHDLRDPNAIDTIITNIAKHFTTRHPRFRNQKECHVANIYNIYQINQKLKSK